MYTMWNAPSDRDYYDGGYPDDRWKEEEDDGAAEEMERLEAVAAGEPDLSDTPIGEEPGEYQLPWRIEARRAQTAETVRQEMAS